MLHPKSLIFLRPKDVKKPDWTQLEYEQCACCELASDRHSHCPIAVNTAELVTSFRDVASSDDCMVRVIQPERTTEKRTSVQRGLFSILGIVMATSGCPSMDMLRPMARFHLPFASIEDTLVRTTSMYLLRQYFEHKKGEQPDMDLVQLNRNYDKIQAVNKGILARISGKGQRDADRNAIIILNSFAQMLVMEFDVNLNSIDYLFAPLPSRFR